MNGRRIFIFCQPFLACARCTRFSITHTCHMSLVVAKNNQPPCLLFQWNMKFPSLLFRLRNFLYDCISLVIAGLSSKHSVTSMSGKKKQVTLSLAGSIKRKMQTSGTVTTASFLPAIGEFLLLIGLAMHGINCVHLSMKISDVDVGRKRAG